MKVLQTSCKVADKPIEIMYSLQEMNRRLWYNLVICNCWWKLMQIIERHQSLTEIPC
jgi:hypothetical protein